jgi:thioredoxin reductase (NADPH)
MHKPIIFAIDDDKLVLKSITRDLKSRYSQDYKIVGTTSAIEALEVVNDLNNNGNTIALFLSDQRMPEMQGVDFLEKAIGVFPKAKKVLLTAYSDTNAAIKAINRLKLDYYLMKPWSPPEEKLYPELDDLLDAWQANYEPNFEGITIIGYQFSPRSHTLKDYLASNLIPYRWLDVRTNSESFKLMEDYNIALVDLPVIIFEDKSVIRKPTMMQIAERLGMTNEPSNGIYDVVIIGAGPAGLASAVYGASEGLKTLLIEKKAPGGQAGSSSRIENYLGFPTGLSGADLTRRAMTQVLRLGAEILCPQTVVDIVLQDKYKIVVLEDGRKINSKSVIISTGVEYKKLDIPGVLEFTGAGIYYGAVITEASSCSDKEVYVLGGGNSAGQGAIYLSKFARNVYIIIRKENLNESMSAYLIDQLDQVDNVHIVNFTELAEARGSESLERLCLRDLRTNELALKPADALYIFIGAKPHTDWIKLDIFKDDKAFIKTGRATVHLPDFNKVWKEKRDPYVLETSSPGIFAAGDVRSDTINRVASAVGEGSMAINLVHRYLAEN